jgi:hypothetical protein
VSSSAWITIRLRARLSGLFMRGVSIRISGAYQKNR